MALIPAEKPSIKEKPTPNKEVIKEKLPEKSLETLETEKKFEINKLIKFPFGKKEKPAPVEIEKQKIKEKESNKIPSIQTITPEENKIKNSIANTEALEDAIKNYKFQEAEGVVGSDVISEPMKVVEKNPDENLKQTENK